MDELEFVPVGADEKPFVSRGGHSVIRASSREALIEGVRHEVPGWDEIPKPRTFIHVMMPCCGRHYEYSEPEDVPAETVPCVCGTPRCYVIDYRQPPAPKEGPP